MGISATFKGINFYFYGSYFYHCMSGIRHNPMVEEYLVRGVLIRANIGHRQYPGR